MHVDYSSLFAAYDRMQLQSRPAVLKRNALQSYLHKSTELKSGSGFQRMSLCR